MISGIKADIWALGVTLYQMNFSRMPFEVEKADMQLLKEQIIESEPDYDLPCLDTTAIDLIQKLLAKRDWR